MGVFCSPCNGPDPFCGNAVTLQSRFESEDTGVLIRAGRSRFKLPSANADEFPRIPTFTAESYHEIAAGLFKEMIRRTVFATDAESSRYALGGVLMEMEGKVSWQ